MTSPAGALPEGDESLDWRTIETGPVVATTLRLRDHGAPNSRFADDSWSLVPLQPRHHALQNLHWTSTHPRLQYSMPPVLTPGLKRFLWLLINHRLPVTAVGRGSGRDWVAPGTLEAKFLHVRKLGAFLASQGIERLAEVPRGMLDDFANTGADHKVLATVALLSASAEWLPEQDRLTEPSWVGTPLNPRDQRGSENTRDPISPEVFATLRWWAERILDCSDDILAAVRSGLELQERRRDAADDASVRTTERIVRELYSGVLPGRRAKDRMWAASDYLQTMHPGFSPRQLNALAFRFTVDPELPQPLPVTPQGLIEGHRWLPHLDYRDIERYQRVLLVAAAVLIAACTGMRGQEVLDLPLGCLDGIARPDGATSFRITGRILKGVYGPDGQQKLEGKPWVWATITPGARAIDVLEALAELTGRTRLFINPRVTRNGTHQGRSSPVSAISMREWIQEFIAFCNERREALDLDHGYSVPVDPHGPVTLERFRRTVSYHVTNQPDGHLAAGVQFGQAHAHTVQGYAGTKTHGIAATMDREATRALYTTLERHARSMKEGEGISGPAAERVITAVGIFNATFRGTFAELTPREEQRLRTDPDLQLYDNPGKFALCMFRTETAACLEPEEPASQPDRLGCVDGCPNNGVTDSTVAPQRQHVDHLVDLAQGCAPSMSLRIMTRAEAHLAHIEAHEQQRTVPFAEHDDTQAIRATCPVRASREKA